MGAETNVRGADSNANDPIEEALRRGDHRGVIALCARLHGASIGRLCMSWCGSQAEAEEAAQETLLTAYDALGLYRAEGSVRAWLFGIARRICARRIELRGRREARLRLVRADGESAPGADALLATRHRADRVRAALETLKPSERDAVVLRYEGELTFREVGLACGIDEAAARKRVSRALERLRGALGDEV